MKAEGVDAKIYSQSIRGKKCCEQFEQQELNELIREVSKYFNSLYKVGNVLCFFKKTAHIFCQVNVKTLIILNISSGANSNHNRKCCLNLFLSPMLYQLHHIQKSSRRVVFPLELFQSIFKLFKWLKQFKCMVIMSSRNLTG